MRLGKEGLKQIGDNGVSLILLTDTDMRVLKRDGGKFKKTINPLGVVTIIPGIQLELGRDMKEFRKCLTKIRRPIGLQRIYNKNGRESWNLIRLQTGNVPEARICSINVIDGIIYNVIFNQDLLTNEEYKRYQRLSVIHQLVAGKKDQSDLLTRAIKTISLITSEPTTKFKMKQQGLKITVTSDRCTGTGHKYKFLFVLDKLDYYNLLNVGLVT